MAPPTFYHMPASPCSRGALSAASLLQVNMSVRNVDLLAGEQLKPEFVKINPQHTIPTLDDNGFVVVDSHAIGTYLADRYGQNESLYPKDVQKRSIVDQRLYFDAGVLYKRLRDICFPIFFLGSKEIANEKIQSVHEALGWLEGYLTPTGWVAGDHITIADAFCVSSVTTYIAEGIELTKYPNILSWIERCKQQIPNFGEIDQIGADQFKEAFQKKLQS